MLAVDRCGAEQQLGERQIEQRLQFVVLPVVADGSSHGGTLGTNGARAAVWVGVPELST